MTKEYFNTFEETIMRYLLFLVHIQWSCKLIKTGRENRSARFTLLVFSIPKARHLGSQ